jgi:hypothetical protein
VDRLKSLAGSSLRLRGDAQPLYSYRSLEGSSLLKGVELRLSEGYLFHLVYELNHVLKRYAERFSG